MIAGPLMDRIDVHVDVRRVPLEKLTTLDRSDSSAVIRARVEAAREVQAARFVTVDKECILVNDDMGPVEVQDFCPSIPSTASVQHASNVMRMSGGPLLIHPFSR